jgi:hypothetical protein
MRLERGRSERGHARAAISGGPNGSHSADIDDHHARQGNGSYGAADALSRDAEDIESCGTSGRGMTRDVPVAPDPHCDQFWTDAHSHN